MIILSTQPKSTITVHSISNCVSNLNVQEDILRNIVMSSGCSGHIKIYRLVSTLKKKKITRKY